MIEEPLCDICAEPVDERGCFHQGNCLCDEHVYECGECRAAAAEDWREDHPMERGSLWP